jgi:WD40 repeat protein
MPDGTKLASYPSEQDIVNPGTSFAAMPDLSLAAQGLIGGRIRVMDLRNGKELWRAVASKEYVLSLAFSPDGKTLASGGGFADSDIRLWDAVTGKQIGQLEGHDSWVSALVFSPDGKKLISSSADQTIRTWDVTSQQRLDVLRGHRQEVWRLALLPDGKTLVSGAKDGTVCFWDTSVTRPRQPHLNIPIPETLLSWCFTPDSRSILVINQQGGVSRWGGADFQRQEPLPEIGKTIAEGWYSPYVFSQDSRFLATGSTNGVLEIWDIARRIRRGQWTNTAGVVVPVKFLPDGNKLVSFSENDNLLHEWDLQTGLEIQSWQAPAQFSAAALAPGEKSCLALGYGGDVVLRDLADQSQKTVELEALETVAASYSPDGKLFAMASDLGYARVWNPVAWGQVATLGGLLNGAHTVDFSPDGKRLAIASDNKEAVKLWDTDSWQDVFTLQGQGTGFQGSWFSPDGNTIGWGSQTMIYLWHAPSWAEINAAEAQDKMEVQQP